MRLWWSYDAKCFHNVKRPRRQPRRASMKLYARGKASRLKHPAECEKCEQIAKTNAHHWDYKRPVDVIFLCHPCHMRVHACMRQVGTVKRKHPNRQKLTQDMTSYDTSELGDLW